MMNDTDGLLPSLDDLLRPSDFDLHRSLAEYSNQVSQEDLLFGPPSLILFEGPPQAEDRWRDGDAALQFPEATGTSSGDQTSPRAPDQSAAAPRQRSGSSGKGPGKVERKAEQNRRDKAVSWIRSWWSFHVFLQLSVPARARFRDCLAEAACDVKG